MASGHRSLRRRGQLSIGLPVRVLATDSPPAVWVLRRRPDITGSYPASRRILRFRFLENLEVARFMAQDSRPDAVLTSIGRCCANYSRKPELVAGLAVVSEWARRSQFWCESDRYLMGLPGVENKQSTARRRTGKMSGRAQRIGQRDRAPDGGRDPAEGATLVVIRERRHDGISRN